MSILLVGISGDLGDTLVRTLIDEADQVRVIEGDPVGAERWRKLGAYVATGAPDDPDLIERAAQNVRTIVLLERDGRAGGSIPAVVEGAKLASVPRILLCSTKPEQVSLDSLRSSGLDYVVLKLPSRRALMRGGKLSRIAPEALADAISAADDLAGHPRLELDLAKAASWRRLNLSPPSVA